MKIQAAFFLFSILLNSSPLLAEVGVTDSTIKIGQISAVTGGSSGPGTATMHGVQALFKQLNDAGGINGRKLQLVHYDDGYEPGRAAEAYDNLAKKDKVFALTSVYGAPSNNAIAPLLERDNMPLIGPFSSANLVDPLRKNIFQVRAHGQQETETLIKHLVEDLAISEIGIFYQDDAMGTAGLNGVDKALAARGLKTHVKASYKRNTDAVDDAVKTFAAKPPKAVFIYAVMPAAGLFAQKIAAAGILPVLVGTTAASTTEFFKVIEPLKIKYFATTSVPPVNDLSFAIVNEYRESMKAANFTDVTPHGLEGFVNAKILAEGIRRAGKNLDRNTLRKSLESMKDMDMGGFKFSFSETNHGGRKEGFLLRLNAGKLQSVSSFKD